MGPDGPDLVTDVPTGTGDADHLGAKAAEAGEWLSRALTRELVLVVDDVQRLPPRSGAVRLLEGLCWYAPDLFRIVLVSRREVPFSLARLRGQGLVSDIDASDLAFTRSEVAEILRRTDVPHDALAEQVWEWTGGWPTAVQAAAEALPRLGPSEYAEALENLVHPGERFHAYLTEEVVGTEPRWVQDLLRRIAVFGGVTSPATIGGEAQDPAAVLADLTRRGLLRRTPGDVSGWTLPPALADYFRHEAVTPRAERAGLLAAAAGECMARGAYGQALRHLVAAGDHERTASLLIDHGAAPLPSGDTDTDAVLQAAELATQPADDVRLQQTLDRARQVRGLWLAAFDSYQRAAGNDEQLRPELGWRIIWMLTMQGEFGKIPSLLENFALEREDALDEAWLLAQVATAHRMVGDLHDARRVAHQALGRARRCGLPSAYGPVHNVLAMLAAADGDRRNVDAHFANALGFAENENDLVQQLWVRVSRAVHVLEMGSPRDAAAEAGPLRALGQKCGVPFLEAHARTTFAQASIRLGALDTAAEELTAAIELFQRLGSRFLAWPLSGLGDLYRIRGQLERARAAYEEALTTAAGGPDSIGSSHALMGLARVRAADDLRLARRLAERAVAMSEPLHQVAALLTRGWVALLGGDRTAAVMDAARAGAVARRRRDDLGLAEAILLSVQASENPSTDVELLAEAIQIWQETGCILDEAVARMAAGSFGGPSARLEAGRAVQTLRASGVDIESRRAAGPLAVLLHSTPRVSIQALGVFQVIRDGVPVPKGEWQSKKARDLIKILVAHRRPTPRDRLAELLWPDSDPGKSANRLSVLLSTVRDILEPRPGEPSPLMSDGSVVWLDSSRVRIDVEEFMERAAAALNAHRSGEPDAPELLMGAVAAHGGQLFEDDPYQEWAGLLAEEIRAKRIAVLRALVSCFRASGDVDRVIEAGLRLLEEDPYDEEVRLDLVAALLEAGRLGEARRHHDIYAARMREIDIEPRPMPRPRRL
ncbi:tetratricopeptide repeat protein [Geodermatophilus sp. SYSU D01186]